MTDGDSQRRAENSMAPLASANLISLFTRFQEVLVIIKWQSEKHNSEPLHGDFLSMANE